MSLSSRLQLLLDIENDQLNGEARYRALFRQLQQAILQGDLAGGEALPATRVLAAELGIARNTVKTAYEMLLAEGYIESRAGAGSFVADLGVAHGQKHLLVKLQKYAVEKAGSELAQGMSGLQPLTSGQRLRMQPAIPALEQFPLGQWRRCLSATAAVSALDVAEPLGEIQLREQIARFLLLHRGIEVSAEQIMITSGSQQAAYMIASLLTRAGDQVWVESPGFAGTSGAFRAQGCRVGALDLHAPTLKLPESGGTLISLTPTRNFPLGHTLPLERRLALINWAEQHNSWIVEDDYDSEFAVGRPVSALYSICPEQRVIYTGTFSRCMFPSLRLGYMVLPENLLELFSQARRYMDGGLSRLPQLALAQFMADGGFLRHLRKMKKLYQYKRAALKDMLVQSPLQNLPLLDAEGGMHLVLGLPEPIMDKTLVAELNQQGMGVRALSAYYEVEPSPSGILLGFCADTVEQQLQAVQQIAATLSRYTTCIPRTCQLETE